VKRATPSCVPLVENVPEKKVLALEMEAICKLTDEWQWLLFAVECIQATNHSKYYDAEMEEPTNQHDWRHDRKDCGAHTGKKEDESLLYMILHVRVLFCISQEWEEEDKVRDHSPSSVFVGLVRC